MEVGDLFKQLIEVLLFTAVIYFVSRIFFEGR